jgi:hypothetical protein
MADTFGSYTIMILFRYCTAYLTEFFRIDFHIKILWILTTAESILWLTFMSAYLRVFASATSLTCLKRHGFIIFSFETLTLHAVKCQATSNDRYVSTNPIAKYIRPTIGSIISIVVKCRTRLIKKIKDYTLIVVSEPKFCGSIITSTYTALHFTIC